MHTPVVKNSFKLLYKSLAPPSDERIIPIGCIEQKITITKVIPVIKFIAIQLLLYPYLKIIGNVIDTNSNNKFKIINIDSIVSRFTYHILFIT